MTDFHLFQDPRTMTDAELDAELMHYKNGNILELLNDEEISDYVKSELVEHGQRIYQECARRDDEIKYPLEAFGVSNFF